MSQAVFMSDLRQFMEALDEASSRTAEDVTTKVVHMMGQEVARLAYLYAPKDTYALANSIQLHPGHREARVTATAPYSAYVEFGTWSHSLINPRWGTYTITPRRPGGVLRFTNAQGQVIFTRKVEHPGIRPQPFMARANAEVIDDFVGKMANVGVMLVLS